MPRTKSLLYAVAGLLTVALAALAVTQVFFPRILLPSHTSLNVLSGDVQVQFYRQTESQPARDGTALNAGDRVVTGAGSSALITFFEGSTMLLEPETEVVITSLLQGRAPQSAATAVGVQQLRGATWSKVQHLSMPASLYQVETPAGVIQARGSLAWVEVDGTSGRTGVRADEGLLVVRAQGTDVELPPFTRTVIEQGQPPAAPRPAPPPAQRLVFTTTSRVWLRVVDAAGRTAGFVSPGLELNQIPGATLSLPFAPTPTITLPVDGAGEYHVVLEGALEGNYQFAVQAFSDAGQVAAQPLEGAIRPGHRFLGRLAVRFDEGKLTGVQVSEFITIREGEGPGKFVRTAAGVAGASQTATAVAVEGTPTPIQTHTPTTTRTPASTAAPTSTETATP